MYRVCLLLYIYKGMIIVMVMYLGGGIICNDLDKEG